ncbi:putative F-box/LRR-repeat protein 9 [Carex rostrata]
MCKSRRWWKPTKYCQVVRSSGCIVVRWQQSDAKASYRRNWAELHPDILLLIFEKLGAIDILTTASLVCRNWHRMTTLEQMLWQRIDMTNFDFSLSTHTLKRIAQIAIDRSAGKLEEFYADCFATDGLLLYIATRTNSLKSIGLFMCPRVSIKGLMAMAQRTKTLRTLRLINLRGEYNRHASNGIVSIIKMLPMLEELELTCTLDAPLYWDTDALQIGENMHELRSLQLIGNWMTNKGLETILEGCPYLEFLDIRNCLNLVLDEYIMTKLSQIRYLKLPDNSADEYMDSISSSYYNYYVYGVTPRPCSFGCCIIYNPEEDSDDDYNDDYYDTFSTLDDIYEDDMFLY